MSSSLFLTLLLALGNVPASPPPPEAPGDSLQQRLKTLTALRTQLDTLSSELGQVREQARQQQQSRAAQISHLQMQVRQEQIRHATLLEKRKALLSETRNIDARRHTLLKPATDVLNLLKDHVHKALPYTTERRLQALDQIEETLTSPEPEPGAALARLFQFLEDERTLNHEVGLSQQVLPIRGERLLVDVAHVGMAALYFRSADHRFGWARPEGSSYRFEFFSNPEHTEAAEALFSSLEQNQRTGYFTLPLIFPKGEP